MQLIRKLTMNEVEMRKAARRVVRAMMPTPKLAGVGLDSDAYTELMHDEQEESGADAEALDDAVREVLAEIGEYGFGDFT